MLLFAAVTVLVRLTDGTTVEGPSSGTVNGTKLEQILSFHSAAPASATEAARITEGLALIQPDKDRAARDLAVADLTAIGLPVLTPLLDIYKDTDQHEPRPLYRLFERIISSEADGQDRSQSVLRLKNGQQKRVPLPSGSITVVGRSIPWSTIRTLAVQQKSVTKVARVHSILHCTQIEYLDSGIALTAVSRLTATASGFTRLSWKDDGWATDPNGLTKPGSPAYKTNLVDGHPFGALVARVTPKSSPFFLGKSYAQPAPGAGRLGLAINDNRHWQNNLGTYTVRLTATAAYDLGDPQ